jgi:oligopeptide transport system permease protein
MTVAADRRPDVEAGSGRSVRRRFLRNRAAAAGLVLLALLAGAGLAAPRIAPYDPGRRFDQTAPQGPSWAHWGGTDLLGRDVLSRVLHGARVSLLVGTAAATVAALIGVAWGLLAGLSGPRVDNALMRAVDLLYGLPYIFFVILLVAWTRRSGFSGYLNLFIGLGAVGWLTMARVVRGQVRALRGREFVEAARALGAGPVRIAVRHLLPHLAGTVIVQATLAVPQAMLEESFLSFLGLGVPPPDASLGTLIMEGTRAMDVHPWLLWFPAGWLALTLLALTFVGDGLRDALDPGR